MPLTDRQILAAKAGRELVDLLPPQDVGHPQKFMAGIVAVLADYHQSVITAAPVAIAKRFDRLTLKAIATVCNELQDAVSRKFERDRAAQSHQLALAAPGKPDQDQRATQVIDWESNIKPVIETAMHSIPSAYVVPRGDGRHFDRIKADLEARRARNEQSEAEPPP